MSTEFASNIDRFALFQVPVFVYDLADVGALNAELGAKLVRESETTPGITRSNVGTWHSIPDLSQRTTPSFRQLHETIVNAVSDMSRTLALAVGPPTEHRYRYGVQSWAMVTTSGGYVIPHDHASAHFSAAYYVDAGDADMDAHPSSGLLAFLSPGRSPAPVPGLDLFPSTFTVQPRSGRLVLFPGSLQHHVHPYLGTRERVCISANVVLEPAA